MRLVWTEESFLMILILSLRKVAQPMMTSFMMAVNDTYNRKMALIIRRVEHSRTWDGLDQRKELDQRWSLVGPT